MKRHLNNILYSVNIIGKESKWYVILNLIMAFENIPGRFLNVWAIEYIVTQAVIGDFNKILYAGFAYFFYLLVVSVVKKTFEECYKKPEEEKIRQSVKMNLYEKMVSFDIAVYDDTEFYNKYVMAFSMVEKKCFEIFNRLIVVFGSIISIGTLFSVIITTSPLVVVFSLIGSLITVLSNFYMSKINYHKEQEILLKNRIMDYINRIYYQQQYSKDVRLENLHAFLMNKFKESGVQKRAVLKKYGKKNVGASVISEGAMNLADVGMWMYIGYGIVNGTLQAGSFMALSNASWSLSNQIRRLFNNFPQLYQDSLFIENIRIFEDYVPKVMEPDTAYPIDKLAVTKITMNNCSFGYNPEIKYNLNNIEFDVQKGQSLAIVGHNGAGKSTLVKLLLRFYDPDKGRIALNGIDIRQFKICELRNCFSVVFQDFQIYSYTIAENILMRSVNSELDEQLVWDALKKVKLDEKVSRLQKGIRTYITKELDEHGIMFSGGELQRLAIARAIVKDAPVIILDEPSSSLDPLAEAEISELLCKLFKDKIIVIISHRLSMTKNAGHIVVLDDGKIVEQGSHNELIQRNGVYAKMWDSQAKKYQDSM